MSCKFICKQTWIQCNKRSLCNLLSCSLANVGCCCRLQVCAGSERAVPQASLGSMVKSQKSAGRKSSQCHRRQVLKKKKTQLCLLVIVPTLPFTVRLCKTHFLYTLLRPKFISTCAKCPLNYRHVVVRFYCVSVCLSGEHSNFHISDI